MQMPQLQSQIGMFRAIKFNKLGLPSLYDSFPFSMKMENFTGRAAPIISIMSFYIFTLYLVEVDPLAIGCFQ